MLRSRLRDLTADLELASTRHAADRRELLNQLEQKEVLLRRRTFELAEARLEVRRRGEKSAKTTEDPALQGVAALASSAVEVTREAIARAAPGESRRVDADVRPATVATAFGELCEAADDEEPARYDKVWSTRRWLESANVASVIADALLAPLHRTRGGSSAAVERVFLYALSSQASTRAILHALLQASPLAERLVEAIHTAMSQLQGLPAALGCKFHSDGAASAESFAFNPPAGGLDALIPLPPYQVRESREYEPRSKC